MVQLQISTGQGVPVAGTERGEALGTGLYPSMEQVQRCFAGRGSAAGHGLFLLSHIPSVRSPVCHCVIAAQGNASELLLIAGIHLRGVFRYETAKLSKTKVIKFSKRFYRLSSLCCTSS